MSRRPRFERIWEKRLAKDPLRRPAVVTHSVEYVPITKERFHDGKPTVSTDYELRVKSNQI